MSTVQAATLPCSRAGILKTIRKIALVPPQRISGAPSWDQQAIGTWRMLVSCPLRTWERRVGTLQNVESCEGDGVVLFQVWEQECADGTATCIGHLVDRPPHGSWVVVVRLCLA
jgi:hypothetical protein